MLKHRLLLLIVGAGLTACDGLPGNEPQYDLIGYWQCAKGTSYFAFTETQGAERAFFGPKRYSIDYSSYRVLQEGPEMLVDIQIDWIPQPWHLKFTSADTFIATLYDSDIICDRTDKASFDALQPPVVFPLPEMPHSNRAEQPESN